MTDHLAALRTLADELAEVRERQDGVMTRMQAAIVTARQAGHSPAEIIAASRLARRTVYRYLPDRTTNGVTEKERSS